MTPRRARAPPARPPAARSRPLAPRAESPRTRRGAVRWSAAPCGTCCSAGDRARRRSRGRRGRGRRRAARRRPQLGASSRRATTGSARRRSSCPDGCAGRRRAARAAKRTRGPGALPDVAPGDARGGSRPARFHRERDGVGARRPRPARSSIRSVGGRISGAAGCGCSTRLASGRPDARFPGRALREPARRSASSRDAARWIRRRDRRRAPSRRLGRPASPRAREIFAERERGRCRPHLVAPRAARTLHPRWRGCRTLARCAERSGRRQGAGSGGRTTWLLPLLVWTRPLAERRERELAARLSLAGRALEACFGVAGARGAVAGGLVAAGPRLRRAPRRRAAHPDRRAWPPPRRSRSRVGPAARGRFRPAPRRRLASRPDRQAPGGRGSDRATSWRTRWKRRARIGDAEAGRAPWPSCRRAASPGRNQRAAPSASPLRPPTPRRHGDGGSARSPTFCAEWIRQSKRGLRAPDALRGPHPRVETEPRRQGRAAAPASSRRTRRSSTASTSRSDEVWSAPEDLRSGPDGGFRVVQSVVTLARPDGRRKKIRFDEFSPLTRQSAALRAALEGLRAILTAPLAPAIPVHCREPAAGHDPEAIRRRALSDRTRRSREGRRRARGRAASPTASSGSIEELRFQFSLRRSALSRGPDAAHFARGVGREGARGPAAARPTSGRERAKRSSTSSGPRSPARGVLDLYAGSGAVGLEAVSRGAARAVLRRARRGGAAPQPRAPLGPTPATSELLAEDAVAAVAHLARRASASTRVRRPAVCGRPVWKSSSPALRPAARAEEASSWSRSTPARADSGHAPACALARAARLRPQRLLASSPGVSTDVRFRTALPSKRC